MGIMATDGPLDKWKISPKVEEIMAHLRKRIEERHAGGACSRDEIRGETAIWLADVMSNRLSDDSVLQNYLDTLGLWRLQLHPNFSSHRGGIGRVLVWLKKRVLYPPLRWIVEVVEVNAWRQDRLNLSLLNLLEEMALEIGRLRARLDSLERTGVRSEPPSPADPPKPSS